MIFSEVIVRLRTFSDPLNPVYLFMSLNSTFQRQISSPVHSSMALDNTGNTERHILQCQNVAPYSSAQLLRFKYRQHFVLSFQGCYTWDIKTQSRCIFILAPSPFNLIIIISSECRWIQTPTILPHLVPVQKSYRLLGVESFLRK